MSRGVNYSPEGNYLLLSPHIFSKPFSAYFHYTNVLVGGVLIIYNIKNEVQLDVYSTLNL